MKKIFLETGFDFDCLVLKEQKVICLIDYDGNRIANISQKDVVFSARTLKHYELLSVAEIAQNFTRYFNLLNQ